MRGETTPAQKIQFVKVMGRASEQTLLMQRKVHEKSTAEQRRDRESSRDRERRKRAQKRSRERSREGTLRVCVPV
jgi:hypothetical protein